ncbi:MAG: hypothetical protein GC153_07675 [Alphaproteobacteria bacterium]|nr:hypothetical protein [Alphaproteobacteria bacterium]
MLKTIAFLLSASAAATLAAAQAPARDYSAPPPKCICGTTPKDVVVFKGVVEDAELRLNAAGTNVQPRQATIFRVTDPGTAHVTGRAKVWHVTDPDDCGVTFNYAKEYTVTARRVKGELETNRCLTKGAPAPSDETPAN